MVDTKELSEEDKAALDRYNNYVARMRKPGVSHKSESVEPNSVKHVEPKNSEIEKTIDRKEIKVPEGTSDEDKAALERYNNYVARMGKLGVKKQNKTSNLSDKSLVQEGAENKINSGITLDSKRIEKQIEEKEVIKKSEIKAPENAKTEDKAALERYNKFVSNKTRNKSIKKDAEKSIFEKDVSSVAWKIRLIFLILALAFFLWALKDQLFSGI